MKEDEVSSPIKTDLAGTQVACSLACGRCGYDLRGLPGDGDCPECGEPVRLTIIDVVDPASRRLPPLPRPGLIGTALLFIAACCLLAVVSEILPLLSANAGVLPVPQGIAMWGTSRGWFIGSGVFALGGLVSVLPLMGLCRAGLLSGCRTGIICAIVGFLSWGTFSIVIAVTTLNGEDPSIDWSLMAVSLAFIFVGLRRLVPRLGQRSRAFRQAQGSRQRMNDLLIALAVLVGGRLLLVWVPADSNLATLARIIIVLCIALIIIGLLYVLRNTWWIRHALVAPPPLVTDLLKGV
jgi:hypothetical protein